MIISKSRFTQYVRCKRLVAFDLLAKAEATISFEDQLKAVLHEEDDARFKTLFESIHEEVGEVEEKEDEEAKPSQDEILRDLLMPQYTMIERLAAKKAIKLFKGKIQFSESTFKQKRIESKFKDHDLLAFIDGYQEDEQLVRIIETKATSSNKFHKLSYKYEKLPYEIFENIGSNILKLKDELPGFEEVKPYYKQRAKLLDPYNGTGKYAFDLAFQRYVIEHSSNRPNKPVHYYLAVLNHEYVYDGRVDENNEPIYDSNEIIKFIDLTIITEQWQPLIESLLLKVIDYIDNQDGAIVPMGDFCRYNKSYEECPFIENCFNDKKVAKVDSIFAYIDGHHGFIDPENEEKSSRFELINKGYTTVMSLKRDTLKHKQQIQYDAFKNNIPYINDKLIKAVLKNITYPRYFLDFESLNPPLPQFKGEKPFTQSVFQFSIHVQNKGEDIDVDKANYYFLAHPGLGDQRIELIKKMIALIPNDGKGTIIVYNQTFENSRLKEMAMYFPQYRKQLESIMQRIFDLMDAIKGSKSALMNEGLNEEEAKTLLYYHRDLQRSYSIKKVLPVFAPELNYGQLNDVQSGIDAQIAYLRLMKLKEPEYSRLYQDMIEYCKLDTWAMVKIVNQLVNIISE